MLLTKTIEYKATSGNISVLSKYNPTVEVGDIVEVPALTFKSSNKKVKVECDYCKRVLDVVIRNYVNSTKKIDKYSCYKQECRSMKSKELELIGINNPLEKRKHTCLKKYGVDNISKTETVKQTKKDKSLKKYGVPSTLQAEVVKQKIIRTNLKRYGFEYPSQSQEVKDKVKQTSLERYGVEHALQDKEVREKIKKTNLERYGVDNVMKSPHIQDIRSKNNIEKYGVSNPIQLKRVKDKAINSMLEKYGVDSLKKYEPYRKKKYKVAQHPNYIEYDEATGENIFKCDKGCDHSFSISSENFHNRIKGKTPLCTVCYPVSDSTSIKQQELFDWIKSCTDKEVINNYRDGLEIDIFIPSLKIGFEFNGLYWHSEEHKDRSYHIKKTKFFLDKGIRIIHIWEDVWDSKKDIIKSQIKNMFGQSERIYARETKTVKITKEEAIEFLEKNHLQSGYGRVKEAFGLKKDSEIVSVMTFDQQEGRKEMEDTGWNLSRFCNKINCTVVGGASKLLKAFAEEFEPTRIVSYADADWSRGGLYEALGFTQVSWSKPDYKYIVNGVREHKSKYRKPKGEQRTEKQIMQELGIPRIWDCGKIKYQK